MKNKTFIIKTLNNKESKEQSILFQGDLGIKNTEAIKNAIQNLKLSSDSFIIHLRNVEKLDVTTIQNISAFRRSLISEGKEVKIKTELTQDIERLLTNTGFKINK